MGTQPVRDADDDDVFDWEIDDDTGDTDNEWHQPPHAGTRGLPQDPSNKDPLPWGPLFMLLLIALVTVFLWRQRQQRTDDSGPSNDDVRRIWAEKWEKDQQQ